MVWSVTLKNKIGLGVIKFYFPVETSYTLSLQSIPEYFVTCLITNLVLNHTLNL